MARVILHEYCGEARQLIEARAYDSAIAICRHILKRYPKHVETYRLLGEACLEKGDLNEAADVFKRLLSADPENFAAYAGLGVIYEERQQLAQAIWHMERAFELAPNNEEIRNALRRLYGQRDGAEPARIKLNKVALARLYSRGGQYRQAIEEFNRSLEAEPKRMDIRLSLAETLWRDARREQAAEVAREILMISPDCLKAILLLGAIQIDKGHADEGQQILARARTLDPENRLAQTLFGDSSPMSVQPVLVPRVLDQSVPIVAVTEPAVCEGDASTELEVEEELIPVLSQETTQPEACSAEAEAAPATAAEPAVVPVAVAAEELCPAPEAFPAQGAPAETLTEAPMATLAEIGSGTTAVAPETVFPVQEAALASGASEESVAARIAGQTEAFVAPTLEATAEAPEAAGPAPVVEQGEALVTPTLEQIPEPPEATAPAPVVEQAEVLVAPTPEATPEVAETSEPVLSAEPVEVLAVPTLEATPEIAETCGLALVAEQAEALVAPTLETAPEPPEVTGPAPVAEQAEVLAAPTLEATPEVAEASGLALVAEPAEVLAAPTLEAAPEPPEATGPAPVAEQAEVLVAPTLEATPEVAETSRLAPVAEPAEVLAAPAAHEAEPTSVAERPEALVAPALEADLVQMAQPAIEAAESSVSTVLAEQSEVVLTPITEAVSTPQTQPPSETPLVALTERAEELSPATSVALQVQEIRPVREAPEAAASAPPVEPTHAPAPVAAECPPAQAPQAALSTPLAETVATEPIGEPAAVAHATPSGTPVVQEAAIPQSESVQASSQQPGENAGTVPEQGPAADRLASTASSAVRSLDVEQYEQQLQQNPKDERTRLSLARVYRDQEQVELALEQYRALARAKTDTLVEAIEDMESIVASRPGNLAAHELLADLYNKNGQLQKAMERYRWLLQQVEPRPV